MANDRLPPHDIDAEEAVNGSLLIDGKSVYQVDGILRPADFLSEPNRWIYQATISLYHRDEAIKQITIAQELERLGQEVRSCTGARGTAGGERRGWHGAW